MLRERWMDLLLVSLATHVIAAAALMPFASQWIDLLRPAADPEIQMARMMELMPRMMGLSALANLLQLAGWGAMAALLGPDRPSLGRALLDGLKATPTMLVSIVFLVVGLYVAIIAIVLVAVAIGVLLGLGLTQDAASPGAIIAGLIGFLAVYFGAIVGALYVGLRFVTLVPVVVLDRAYNPFTALARAWSSTRGNGWTIVGLFLMLWIPLALALGAIVFAFLPPLASIEEGTLAFDSLAPLWMAMIPVNIALALLMVTLVVAIHRQLTAEEPANTD